MDTHQPCLLEEPTPRDGWTQTTKVQQNPSNFVPILKENLLNHCLQPVSCDTKIPTLICAVHTVFSSSWEMSSGFNSLLNSTLRVSPSMWNNYYQMTQPSHVTYGMQWTVHLVLITSWGWGGHTERFSRPHHLKVKLDVSAVLIFFLHQFRRCLTNRSLTQ